jgi:hypothetical protein
MLTDPCWRSSNSVMDLASSVVTGLARKTEERGGGRRGPNPRRRAAVGHHDARPEEPYGDV